MRPRVVRFIAFARQREAVRRADPAAEPPWHPTLGRSSRSQRSTRN
jgi:hypothetical protein